MVYESELYHYGRKGMKWYQHIYGETDSRAKYSIPKNTEKNIGKWGKRRDKNVLYIAGYSGSGKSTLAEKIAKKNNAEVINLDHFFEKKNQKYIKDGDFKNFIEKEVPDYLNMADRNFFKDNIKEWGNLVDRFAGGIQKYGEQQFLKQKKVIVEGVQIADGTLIPDLSYYSKVPTILVETPKDVSMKRSASRDSNINDRRADYDAYEKRLNEFRNIINNKIIEKNGEKMSQLQHSAKGTSWIKKDHKYIKKVDGKYYYRPESYKSKKIDNNTAEEKTEDLSKKSIKPKDTEYYLNKVIPVGDHEGMIYTGTNEYGAHVYEYPNNIKKAREAKSNKQYPSKSAEAIRETGKTVIDGAKAAAKAIDKLKDVTIKKDYVAVVNEQGAVQLIPKKDYKEWYNLYKKDTGEKPKRVSTDTISHSALGDQYGYHVPTIPGV